MCILPLSILYHQPHWILLVSRHAFDSFVQPATPVIYPSQLVFYVSNVWFCEINITDLLDGSIVVKYISQFME